jgi:hypothetical protein
MCSTVEKWRWSPNMDGAVRMDPGMVMKTNDGQKISMVGDGEVARLSSQLWQDYLRNRQFTVLRYHLTSLAWPPKHRSTTDCPYDPSLIALLLPAVFLREC